MKRHALAVGLLLSQSACGPKLYREEVRDPNGAQSPKASDTQVRYFLSNPSETFWVAREGGARRVVAKGLRVVATPTGEILDAATWSQEDDARNTLLGSLAVAEHLGGGYVHWTRRRLFRSREFTGPVTPIAMEPTEVTIVGARNGLRSVFVALDIGARELRPGSDQLEPARTANLLDEIAVTNTEAVEVDFFGHLRLRSNANGLLRELTPLAGKTGPYSLASGPEGVIAEFGSERFLIGSGGSVSPQARRGRYGERDFQDWGAESQEDSEGLDAKYTDAGLFGAAIATGASLGDGTAVGVAAQSLVGRVDLRTGALLGVLDAFPTGLMCQSLKGPDRPLFACLWPRYQGYGGYVFRADEHGFPRIEHAFSDDGSFSGGGDGALGFVGSCKAEVRYIDDDASRYEGGESDSEIPPVFCVRRADGAWFERRIDPPSSGKIVAWVPRLDGTAIALVQSTDPLPPPATMPRVAEQAGVTIIQVLREFPQASLAATQWTRDRRGTSLYIVDRRFQARKDGGVDGWIALGPEDGSSQLALGITIDAAGRPEIHDLAPNTAMTLFGGRFGLSITQEGDGFETSDFGRTWRSVGRLPLVPGPSGRGADCSELGCNLGPLVRVGWGESELKPATHPVPEASTERPARPSLLCTPSSLPTAAARTARAHSKTEPVRTTFGPPYDLERNADGERPSKPGSSPRKTTVAAPKATTLFWQPPLEPHSTERRIVVPESTEGRFGSLGSPLMTPDGRVALLVSGGQRLYSILGDTATALPGTDRRKAPDGTILGGGLWLDRDHLEVLSQTYRALVAEVHGPAPAPATHLVGGSNAAAQRRTVTLGRRDDGTMAFLFFNGPAPSRSAAAVLDRWAAMPQSPVDLAAWSTLTTADDPRCTTSQDRGFRALVVLEPKEWFSDRPLPGISYGQEGLALVRWSGSRVCLEGIEMSVEDDSRRGAPRENWQIVVRWDEGKQRGAVLRSSSVRQDLRCRVENSRSD